MKYNFNPSNKAIKSRLVGQILSGFQCGLGRVTMNKPLEWYMGCSFSQAKRHIESQFRPGMSWRNIHVDHIIPISSFDLKSTKQQRACFCFKNLQPLWPRDNSKKGASLDPVSYRKRPSRKYRPSVFGVDRIMTRGLEKLSRKLGKPKSVIVREAIQKTILEHRGQGQNPGGFGGTGSESGRDRPPGGGRLAEKKGILR